MYLHFVISAEAIINGKHSTDCTDGGNCITFNKGEPDDNYLLKVGIIARYVSVLI